MVPSPTLASLRLVRNEASEGVWFPRSLASGNALAKFGWLSWESRIVSPERASVSVSAPMELGEARRGSAGN